MEVEGKGSVIFSTKLSFSLTVTGWWLCIKLHCSFFFICTTEESNKRRKIKATRLWKFKDRLRSHCCPHFGAENGSRKHWYLERAPQNGCPHARRLYGAGIPVGRRAYQTTEIEASFRCGIVRDRIGRSARCSLLDVPSMVMVNGMEKFHQSPGKRPYLYLFERRKLFGTMYLF